MVRWRLLDSRFKEVEHGDLIGESLFQPSPWWRMRSRRRVAVAESQTPVVESPTSVGPVGWCHIRGCTGPASRSSWPGPRSVGRRRPTPVNVPDVNAAETLVGTRLIVSEKMAIQVRSSRRIVHTPRATQRNEASVVPGDASVNGLGQGLGLPPFFVFARN